MIKKKTLTTLFGTFEETWTPKICGEVNDTLVKVAKFDGEFVWHTHTDEDEMFFVVSGRLRMKLRDQPDVVLEPGEFLIVPKGTEHKPVAETPCEVMLIEPRVTLNTGNIRNDRTVSDLESL